MPDLSHEVPARLQTLEEDGICSRKALGLTLESRIFFSVFIVIVSVKGKMLGAHSCISAVLGSAARSFRTKLIGTHS